MEVFSNRLLFKQLAERDLWFVGAWSLRGQLLWQHEHGIRAYERGDACVVGEFVLAYLYYCNDFLCFWQH